jgi:hypothetical protein
LATAILLIFGGLIAWFGASIIWMFIRIVFDPSYTQSRKVKGRPVKEEDFWDEVDGGTYIVLPNGEVRLDNNGKASK